jgi:hypothetical protein
MSAVNEDEILAASRAAVRLSGKTLSFLFLILFPTVLSIWVGILAEDHAAKVWFWLVIVLISGLQMFAFVKIDIKASEHVPSLFYRQMQLEEACTTGLVENEALADELESALSALTVGQIWSSIQANMAARISNGDTPTDIIEECVKPLLAQADKIFGFQFDELWSVVAYEWDAEKLLLVPKWWKRAPGHPAGDRHPREWRSGEGHCGTAFMSEKMLFTNDMAEPATLNRVQPTPENIRRYDASAYRSFATVPLRIFVGESASYLGVVAITSDKPGRFGDVNVDIVGQLADVMAQAIWIKQAP